MKNNLIGALILSTFPMPSFGDVSEAGNITGIIVEGSSFVSVFLDGVDVNTECSGGGRWTLDTSDPLFKEKYAALLAAAASGKKVNLYHLSGLGCGNWISNRIYYVHVQY